MEGAGSQLFDTPSGRSDFMDLTSFSNLLEENTALSAFKRLNKPLRFQKDMLIFQGCKFLHLMQNKILFI